MQVLRVGNVRRAHTLCRVYTKHCLRSAFNAYYIYDDRPNLHDWCTASLTLLQARFAYPADPKTIKFLELIEPLRQNIGASGVTASRLEARTMFGQMNSTSTAAGARLLRTVMLQPTTDVTVINARLDAIDELLQSEMVHCIGYLISLCARLQIFMNMRALVARLVDVSGVVATLTQLNTQDTLRSAEYKIMQVRFYYRDILCFRFRCSAYNTR